MTTATPTPTPAPAPGVKETWMPTTAGILTVISGACHLLIGLTALVWAELIGDFFGIFGFGIIGVPYIIIGIISIIGGVFAIKRRTWWLALVGAIFALMWPSSLFGVLSIIFVCISKKEFK